MKTYEITIHFNFPHNCALKIQQLLVPRKTKPDKEVTKHKSLKRKKKKKKTPQNISLLSMISLQIYVRVAC